ncbi:MAG TPA: SDR family oxidoreductase, partial [Terriglobales bacterium]|nr:SDR family oxidoreductase [Terriglobales bacterium]
DVTDPDRLLTKSHGPYYAPTAMGNRLSGKVAVITGGASGIGRGIAQRYVDEGVRVVLADRNGPLVQETAKALGAAAAAVEMDVTREADVERAVAEARARFGGVHIGVNCAGLGISVPLTEQTEAQWDTVVDVCLKGVFLSMKHEARAMAPAGGVIINIASINARQPGAGLSAYCAAKAGVEMLTRVAALELGPRNIRVVGIGPGLIDTPLTTFQQERPHVREAFLENVPLGRVGTTDDIAGAALFLASDDASWISGDTLFVDGAALTKKFPELGRFRRPGA